MPSISVFIFLSPSLCFCPSFPDSLSLCLFSLWVCLCVSVSVSLSLCLCLLISVSLSPSLSFWVSVLMSPWLYVCISLGLCLYISLTTTLSLCQSRWVNLLKVVILLNCISNPNFQTIQTSNLALWNDRVFDCIPTTPSYLIALMFPEKLLYY